GERMILDERVNMISFTGSTTVGKKISSLATLKHLHLELGGKGLAIVLDDADLNLAAKKCVEGALKNAGQRCDAISLIAVQTNIHNQFITKVLEEVRNWKVGPLINQEAVRRIHSLVEDAIQKGAKLLIGGAYHGHYYQPTILDSVPLNSEIVYEETFGPVVTIVVVKDEDEAIELAKKSRYGLDSCVFTSSFYRMWKVAKKLEVGEITVNDLPKHGVGYFPFGGWKDSGIGREGIGYSIDEMTRLKTIIFNLEPAGLGKLKHLH
ncbi:MAG: aldehyde dehydrogenase family protein, partial [Nitrososphaerales archaeon]